MTARVIRGLPERLTRIAMTPSHTKRAQVSLPPPTPDTPLPRTRYASNAEVKMSNPLRDLAKTGQSVWFDQMERRLVTSGELQRMIDEDDLRGLTSNPTIFEKAIGGSDDYEAQLRTLASQNKSRDEIYDAITIEDIGNAADVFRPAYDRCKGGDGFCSLEVSPI